MKRHSLSQSQSSTCIQEMQIPEHLSIQCAWCLAEAHLPMGEGSHGICDRHAQQVEAEFQARRVQKKGSTR